MFSALEKCQNELDDERQMAMEHLTATPVEDRLVVDSFSKKIHSVTLLLSSPSVIEGYRKHIEELQENLLQKAKEQAALQERLDEVEFELKTTLEDHALKAIQLNENLQSLIQQTETQTNEKCEENILLALNCHGFNSDIRCI